MKRIIAMFLITANILSISSLASTDSDTALLNQYHTILSMNEEEYKNHIKRSSRSLFSSKSIDLENDYYEYCSCHKNSKFNVGNTFKTFWSDPKKIMDMTVTSRTNEPLAYIRKNKWINSDSTPLVITTDSTIKTDVEETYAVDVYYKFDIGSVAVGIIGKYGVSVSLLMQNYSYTFKELSSYPYEFKNGDSMNVHSAGHNAHRYNIGGTVNTNHQVQYYDICDKQSATFYIDTQLPSTPNVVNNLDGTITLNSTDTASGISQYGFAKTLNINDITWQDSPNINLGGSKYFILYSKDQAGNISYPTLYEADTTPPTAPTISHNGSSNWQTSDVTVTVTPGTDSESGIVATEYKIDNGTWQTYTAPFVVSNSAKIIARSTNGANLSTLSPEVNLKIDKTPPTAPNIAPNNTNWNTSNVTVVITAGTDFESGIVATEYKIDNGTWQTYTAPFIVSNTAKIVARSTNGANLSTSSSQVNLKIDKTPPTAPTVTHTGSSSWNTSDVEVSITPGTDAESGIIATEYKIDNGSWQTYTAPFIVANTSKIIARSTNGAGLETLSPEVSLKIDKTPPMLTYSLNNSGFTTDNVLISAIVSDDDVGTFTVVDDDGNTYNSNFTYLATENKTYNFLATDSLGNSQNYQITIDKIDRVLPASDYVISNTDITNQDITLTVNSSDVGSGLATIKFNNETKTSATSVFTITQNGSYNLIVTDKVGNLVNFPINIANIDKNVPEIKGASVTSDKKLVVSALDIGSGLDKYSFDNGTTWQDDNFIENAQFQIYDILVKDKAGNISQPLQFRVQNIDVSVDDKTNNNGDLIIDKLPGNEQGRTDVEEITLKLLIDNLDNKIDKGLATNVLEPNKNITNNLDISLIKTVKTSAGTEVINLTELDEPITITLDRPKNVSDSVTVIRVHNGVAEALETQVINGKIVFQTDKFSSYFISSEPVKSNGSGGGGFTDGTTNDTTIDDKISDILDDLIASKEIEVSQDGEKAEVDFDLDAINKLLESLGLDTKFIEHAIIPYTIKDDKEIIAKISMYQDGKVKFIAPVKGKYNFKFNVVNFNDTKNSWSEEYIAYSSAREILKGTEKDKFAPQMNVSRGMLAEIIYRLKSVDFTSTTHYFEDVGTNKYYAAAINFLYEKGFVKGYSSSRFGADDSVTREQLAVIYANAFDIKSDAVIYFKDKLKVSKWAERQVNSMYAFGILQGDTNGFFNPIDFATREQIAKIVYKVNEYLLR